VTMSTRDRLHQLVDALPDRQLPVVQEFIESLHGERSRRLPRALQNAIEDDEPDTEVERAAADQAWQEYRRGERITADQVRRELDR
jgi:hypothetical protein